MEVRSTISHALQISSTGLDCNYSCNDKKLCIAENGNKRMEMTCTKELIR